MPLGFYVSVPFCRTKCSYCNFASNVFSRTVFDRYVGRLTSDIEHARETAQAMGGNFDDKVDSVYLGGGTPTVLDSHQLERLFVTIRQNFRLQPQTEITVECAPGTLTEAVVETLVRCGVNRVSLGVQSFVNQEAAAVGRLHKRQTVFEDIARLRSAGIMNINLDLIAGLPHQTADSWEFSLTEAIGAGAPHISVYMLEVDEDSRLGRELIAGGTRYHAHFVPDEDLTADFYTVACERIEAAGIRQYEISNFASVGSESRHNLKYWTRQPYFGFGVDAHSMLPAADDLYVLGRASEGKSGAKYGGSPACEAIAADIEAVRFASTDSLEKYVAGAPLIRTPVPRQSALEETFFLGLRLTTGVDLEQVQRKFGVEAVRSFSPIISELVDAGFMESENNSIRLTSRGRLLSNEVFERFLIVPAKSF
jgi:oxygen-independent coproporphyrinogen III oxidase